jgi:hypothetical protein
MNRKDKSKEQKMDVSNLDLIDKVEDHLAHLRAIVDLLYHVDGPELREGTLSTISESALDHLQSLEDSIHKFYREKEVS